MSILLEQLTKRYAGQPVVNHVSLEVGDGEFFVLLGSSGSGKTTILSLIAGLIKADHGRVLLSGRDVTNLPAQQRRVGFVFQNYALFQHMTVADNIEFGLSIRKVAAAERRRRCDELLELVGLSGLGNRMPRQLSGGEQQRVALARALAHQPEVLLLDEPLGALDAKIRTDLRRTLRAIQRKLGIATILVTHDQEEAFDLADRMGIMSYGRLLEVGRPEELYLHPQTEFVATFLGTANLLVGRLTADGVRLGPVQFPLAGDPHPLAEEQRAQVLFRPEDVILAPEREALGCSSLGQAEVEEMTFAGAFERLRLRLPPIPGVRPIAPPVSFGSRSILVDAVRSPEQAGHFPLTVGGRAWVGVRRVHTLAHPGLSFSILSDGSPAAQPAIDLGGKMARLSHARLSLIGYGSAGPQLEAHLQEARKQLGSGVASLQVHTLAGEASDAVAGVVESQLLDLLIMGFTPASDVAEAEKLLSIGEHHLMLVPRVQPVPSKVLVCVSSGEPSKEDVLFTGRLIRHLGARATLLTVIPEAQADPALRCRVERFLEGGVQALSVLGVEAEAMIRIGAAYDEIVGEMHRGGYDLLVLGAPLSRFGKDHLLSGLVRQYLSRKIDCAVLIVHSHYLSARLR